MAIHPNDKGCLRGIIITVLVFIVLAAVGLFFERKERKEKAFKEKFPALCKSIGTGPIIKTPGKGKTPFWMESYEPINTSGSANSNQGEGAGYGGCHIDLPENPNRSTWPRYQANTLVCVTSEYRQVQSCTLYSGMPGFEGGLAGTIRRLTCKVTITLVDVESGQPIASNSFNGDAPPPCPEKEVFSEDPKTGRAKDILLNGSPPKADEIKNWLQQNLTP